MKRLNDCPVIFLAFANDRVRENAYLRNLPEELRQIRNELQKAKNAGLCEIIERTNATIDDLLNVFQDESYKNRIAVFHYSGHANGYKLLLETYDGGPSPAHKEGLIPFLAAQKSLQLIFLNGCSTRSPAYLLTVAGIPAVIGTSQAINDYTASILSTRFYNGLANGLAIDQAWNQAQLEVKIRIPTSHPLALYKDGYTGDTHQFPWKILYKKGAEIVKEWNLPHAANNPLFGLPPIPQTYTLPKTPFLFLNRCTGKYARLFFGRSNYIRDLYHHITDKNTSPIILLYGQSGVGKSSLLQAGLVPRLKATHTCIYIKQNHRQGLSKTLEKSLTANSGAKPLLIIMDQMEEVFRGSVVSADTGFMETLYHLFGTPGLYPTCKLILGFRKEYYPEIEARFKKHALPRFPLFLQPLSRPDIIEIVTGLTSTPQLKNKYHLEVEEGLPSIIADDLLEDRHSPIAPTLQILLTKMWDASNPDDFSPYRQFTIKQYRRLRKEGLLMKDFFKQQMKKIENWKKETLLSGLALDMLKFHTTSLGTSRSRDIQTIRRTYPHRLEIIEPLLGKLKDLYLLTDTNYRRDENDTSLIVNPDTGLAHDTLAPIVIKEYNDSDKPGQRAARILTAKLGESNCPCLDESDLKLVEEGQKGMKALSPEAIRLLETSRNRKKKREKKIRSYQMARRVLSVLVFLFALVALWKWDQAVVEGKRANAGLLVSRAQLLVNQDPTVALRLAEQALKMGTGSIDNDSYKAAIYKIYRQNSFYKIIATQATPITALAVSPDGTILATGSPHGTLFLWNRRGKMLYKFKAHSGKILSIAFSPGVRADVKPASQNILTGSMDRTARMWNLEGKQIKEFSKDGGFVLSVSFSPNGKYILTSSADKTIRLWDTQGNVIRVIRVHKNRILSTAFSRNSKLILSGSSDGSAGIWDLQGKQIRVFNVPHNTGHHKQPVTFVSFSPYGKYILTASRDNTARLWDVNGTLVQVFKGHDDKIVSAVFSADGKYIFTASRDQTIRLWALKGLTLTEFDGHKDRVYHVAFSSKGSYVLTGSRDRTARLWDLQGKQLYNIMNHDGSVLNVGFSTNGKHIVTGTENGKTYWWNLKGEPLHGRHGDFSQVGVAAPRGKYSYKTLKDGTVQLFNSQGNHFHSFTGHKGNVNAVDFSPDGKYIITASFDTTARLWEIPMAVQDFLNNGTCQRFTLKQLKQYRNKKNSKQNYP